MKISLSSTLDLFRSFILKIRPNKYHPLVWINGDPKIGRNVYIGGFSEINAKGASIIIGDECDIASFVSINCADSHLKCIGRSDSVYRGNITIERNVFIGTHSVVTGNVIIGEYSVIAAGTIVRSCVVPPYSLVIGNPMKIMAGHYKDKKNCNSLYNK